MKKASLLTTLVLIITIAAQAQQLFADTTHIKSQSYYNQKRNKNNSIGWVCLGSGLTLGGIGLIAMVGSAFKHGSSKTGEGIAVAGEVVALASIPFFVIAHHNKQQAKLALGNQTIAFTDRLCKTSRYPKVSLTIDF